jgi:hypothetical protein
MSEPDLFGGTLQAPASAGTPGRAAPGSSRSSSRSFAKPAGGTPREALDALADIHHGRLGVLDNTDRIVRFTDWEQVRQARNDDVIAALVRSGYVTENDKDRMSCLHGAVRRPVVPLTLTRTGRTLLERWSALQGT